MDILSRGIDEFFLIWSYLPSLENSNSEVRMKNLRLMVQKLPKEHNQLLLYLCRYNPFYIPPPIELVLYPHHHHLIYSISLDRFLNKVASHKMKNKMSIDNLATCWYPNFIRYLRFLFISFHSIPFEYHLSLYLVLLDNNLIYLIISYPI